MRRRRREDPPSQWPRVPLSNMGTGCEFSGDTRGAGAVLHVGVWSSGTARAEL